MFFRSIALALPILLVSGLSFTAQAGSIDAIDVFGDSLSDVGNVYAATGIPVAPYVNGQFTNGNVWVQDLATALGVGPIKPSLAGGTDYAYGSGQSGQTLFNPTPGPQDLTGTLGQINQFIAANPKGADPNALYTIWIGANDLFNIPATASMAQIQADTGQVISNIDSAITTLASLNAKNFLIVTVPDLGKTPFALSAGSSASTDASLLSGGFDAALVNGSGPLPSLGALASADGVNISVLNTYALLDTIVSNPASYGFTDVTDPCYTGTYAGPTPTSTLCPNPDQYLFFDQVHPTAAGQQIIADAALGVLVPEPASMILVSGGLLGLLLLRRRYSGAFSGGKR